MTEHDTTELAGKVLREMLGLDLHQCTVTVCLASFSKDDERTSFERLQLSDDLTEDFRGVAKTILKGLRRKIDKHDLIVQEYAVGSKLEPHEIEHIDLSAQESIKTQIAPLSMLPTVSIFSAQSNFVSNLRFYVIIVQPKNAQPIYCFRTYSPKKELTHSLLFAAMLAKGQFDRVREPMFLFDQHIDCISYGDNLFIINKYQFQRIFRYFEMILKSAHETLALIKSRKNANSR